MSHAKPRSQCALIGAHGLRGGGEALAHPLLCTCKNKSQSFIRADLFLAERASAREVGITPLWPNALMA